MGKPSVSPPDAVAAAHRNEATGREAEGFFRLTPVAECGRMLHLAASPVSKEALSLCFERLSARPVARQVGAETEGFFVGSLMRDYSRLWIDRNGAAWAVVESRRALKFNVPCHAALRSEVFSRDRFACRNCGAKAKRIPAIYSGRWRVETDTLTGSGTGDALIVDHILSRAAGGTNYLANLQTLCETCNRRKGRLDRADTAVRGQR